MQFDRTLLQANDSSMDPKLPKLEFKGAETVSVGANNQVDSSSMLYTIFRREVENNMCESVGDVVGSMGMELIYFDVVQNPGWSNKNIASIEFEVRIFDKNVEPVWSHVYSGELNDPDSGLLWVMNYSDTSTNNVTAKLTHQLIENLKSDLQHDYEKISMGLASSD